MVAWNDRLDLLVHALAQLPDHTRLEVDNNHLERDIVELLGNAYGIKDRVRFVAPTTRYPRGVLVHARSHTSPIAPPISAYVSESMAELVESVMSPDDEPASMRKHDDSILAGHRVGFVTNLPAHYRLPLFDSIAERLAEAGAEFRVFFVGGRTLSRPWLVDESHSRHDHEVLRGIELPLGSRRPHLPVNLEAALGRFAPTLILCGGFSPFVATRVARLAKRWGTPWGVWSGETSVTGATRSRLRRLQRQHLVRRADFAVAYGHAAGEYIRELRPDLPLVYGRNTAPLAKLPSTRLHESEIAELLVVGDLASPRKGVDVVIDALRRAPKLRCHLTVVGAGELLPKLVRRAEGDPRMHFTGALSPLQVRELYGRADIVLFPTRSDVFGLVLVEAMGAGAAVAVSPAAGAVADLAVQEYNCIVVAGYEAAVWEHAISRLVEDSDLRRTLGSAATRTIHNRWTIDHAADAMLAGLRLGVLLGQKGGNRR